jgi:NAD(P)H-hydrate epimerase
LGVDVGAVEKSRIRLAREFAAQYDVITVLKSDNTVVALPDGIAYINTIGNSGLAKGGSGDLLSGLIASLCASGVAPGDSAVLGVYLHALAADLAAETTPKQCMTPTMVAQFLPVAVATLGAQQ